MWIIVEKNKVAKKYMRRVKETTIKEKVSVISTFRMNSRKKSEDVRKEDLKENKDIKRD